MSHEQLWAPWRLSYILKPKDQTTAGAERCFLCRCRDEPDRDRENLVVARGSHSLVVLNRFPYNNGHLLVAPLAHKGNLVELSDDELCDVSREVRRMTDLLGRLMQPEGFNVGLNLGRTAGAGLPGHVHWHIVPRWNGDTNFMPVIADVNVIPQSLEALYEFLKASDGPGA